MDPLKKLSYEICIEIIDPVLDIIPSSIICSNDDILFTIKIVICYFIHAPCILKLFFYIA